MLGAACRGRLYHQGSLLFYLKPNISTAARSYQLLKYLISPIYRRCCRLHRPHRYRRRVEDRNPADYHSSDLAGEPRIGDVAFSLLYYKVTLARRSSSPLSVYNRAFLILPFCYTLITRRQQSLLQTHSESRIAAGSVSRQISELLHSTLTSQLLQNGTSTRLLPQVSVDIGSIADL
jgi:hypothetical protein